MRRCNSALGGPGGCPDPPRGVRQRGDRRPGLHVRGHGCWHRACDRGTVSCGLAVRRWFVGLVWRLRRAPLSLWPCGCVAVALPVVIAARIEGGAAAPAIHGSRIKSGMTSEGPGRRLWGERGDGCGGGLTLWGRHGTSASGPTADLVIQRSRGKGQGASRLVRAGRSGATVQSQYG